MYFLRPRGRGGVVEGSRRVLNSDLWSSLPEDLMERVLTKLPLSSVVKCRTVCKRWNELILSPNFTPAEDCPAKCVPFHFTFFTPAAGTADDRYFTAYDARRNTWSQLSLSFLRLDPSMGSWEMAASGGGLLCLSTYTCSQFVVCNPVTKRWRVLHLPCLDSDEPYLALPPNDCNRPADYHRPMEHLLVGLMVCKDTGNYKLIIAETYDPSQRTTLVYDSRERSWSRGANSPRLPSSCFSRKPGIPWKGALYWVADDDDRCCPRLFKYDVEKDSWATLLLASYGWDVRILEHRSQLVLMTEEGRACTLHESGQKIRLEQKKMPKPLTVKLVRHNGDDVQNSSCVGAGELICFIREFQTQGKCRTRLEFIVRDFSTNTSTCTANLEFGYVLLCWVLEPSLTALA